MVPPAGMEWLLLTCMAEAAVWVTSVLWERRHATPTENSRTRWPTHSPRSRLQAGRKGD